MSKISTGVAELSVLHLGAGRYKPDDRSHPTFDIWRALAQGFRCYTVIGRSSEPVAVTLQEGNLTVYLLPSRIAREAEFIFTQFLAIQIAKTIKADVVISQSPVLGGFAGLAISRKCGAKHLVELHGSEFVSRATFGSENWFLQFFSNRILRHAHRIRALSDGMKERVICMYGMELASRIVVLPPRVDLGKFVAKSDWSCKEFFRVVMVGAVNTNKGQRRLIEALLQSSLPSEIWIIGEGPELPACKKVASQLGGEERVHFFGRMAHTELSKILLQADVFIMFSTHEGTPRAILEAMAVGLPIVTTDAGFCADIVAHNVEGFVLGSDPEQEVVGVLQRLFDDPKLRARMGQAARKRAIRDYDSIKLYDRYRAFIRETATA